MDNNNHFRGIIFDLDGTLVDTAEDLTDALNDVLNQYELPPVTVVDMKHMIGNGLRMVIIRAFPEELTADKHFVDTALDQMKAAYKKRWVNKSKAYPDIAELLTYCQDNGIRLGVSSNKVDDAVNFIVKTIFPNITFDAVIGNRDGIPHKPNPTQTNIVIEKLGLSPDKILYVGDSETDYRTALNSKLFPLILTYGYGNYDLIKTLPGLYLRENAREIIPFLAKLRD